LKTRLENLERRLAADLQDCPECHGGRITYHTETGEVGADGEPILDPPLPPPCPRCAGRKPSGPLRITHIVIARQPDHEDDEQEIAG
jgi:hypothetical protein